MQIIPYATRIAVPMVGGAGGLSQFNIVYLSGSNTVLKTDGDVYATARAFGICLEDISAAATGLIQRSGIITNTGWSLTVGAFIYVSGTAGGITETPLTTSGGGVCLIGQATTSDTIFLDIGLDVRRIR